MLPGFATKGFCDDRFQTGDVHPRGAQVARGPGLCRTPDRDAWRGTRGSACGGYSKSLNTSHPTASAIVRHSNAGISNDHKANAGHVDHSGIASVPTQVQTLGENGGCQRLRDFSALNHNVPTKSVEVAMEKV